MTSAILWTAVIIVILVPPAFCKGPGIMETPLKSGDDAKADECVCVDDASTGALGRKTTCKAAVAALPGFCYEYDFETECCQSCEAVKDSKKAGCEYGNRLLKNTILNDTTCEDVIATEPYACYDSNVETLCCKSCGDIKNSENEKCPYGEAQGGFIGENRMTCQDALAMDPGYCYFHAQKCCLSCLPLAASGTKSCPYGEVKHGFIGEEALTCKKALEEDPGHCYFHADKCCESCPQIAKNDNAGCEYGNRPLTETIMGYDTCEEAIAAEPNACYDSNVERLCCKSCGDIKESENAGPVKKNSCGVSSVSLDWVPGFDLSVNNKVNGTMEGSNRRCGIPVASSAGCEYGDKPRKFKRYKSCEEAVAAKPSRCYEEEIAQKCCKSCGDHKSDQPGCPYGNRLRKQFTDRSGMRRKCKAITGHKLFYCYEYEDACCGTCYPLKTKVAGCEYGDRRGGCKKIVRTHTGYCNVKIHNNLCCKTCAEAKTKKAP